MPILLAVDDDRAILYQIQQAFKDSAISLLTVGTAEEALNLLPQGPDVVVLDIVLPDMSGLEAFQQIQASDAKLPVIFMTALGTSDTAIEAMKLGAYDYLLKPLDLPKLRELVERALEIRRLMHVPVDLPRGDSGTSLGDQIIGRSQQMQDVFKAIGRVAPQNVTVLIHGESGTGKELVARAIYHHSNRAGKQFLAVNCAAIPEALLESELFGHEKGSFTSADHRRIGKFEQCSGGTIFLDEVGDMSPLVQSKVLRVLQEQRFERVGGTETIQTDVRIITATNRNLKHMAATGEFRDDLYYRLNGFTINLPPLRERGDDILLLLESFLRRISREIGKDVHGISPDALDLLIKYRWPGNVRELEAVVRQALLQSAGPVIVPDFLPCFIQTSVPEFEQCRPDGQMPSDLESLIDRCLRSGSSDVYSKALEFVDRYVVTRVLQYTDGNQSQAAKLLGITRGSLRFKIRSLRITLEKHIRLDDETENTADADCHAHSSIG